MVWEARIKTYPPFVFCFRKEKETARVFIRSFGQMDSWILFTREFNLAVVKILYYISITRKELIRPTAEKCWISLPHSMKNHTKNLEILKSIQKCSNMKWLTGCKQRYLISLTSAKSRRIL